MANEKSILSELRSAKKELKAVEKLFNEDKATMSEHHAAIERVEVLEIIRINGR